MSYADRAAAGRTLATRLQRWRGSGALVLALPRGGVPVAAEIARDLGLELGLALVRKVGMPGHRELAVAALAGPSGETLVTNPDVMRAAGLDADAVAALASPERHELARRAALWLSGQALPVLTGRTVILVDDGLATGATMRAALVWARAQKPARLIVAVPVGAEDTLAAIAPMADEVHCPLRPHPFRAVGAHYDDFAQVPDADVTRILRAVPKPGAKLGCLRD
ncbi:MAG: putative phosphoribosyl transferase [Rhodobacteraceae bacterium HLUCCA12]|nr:MAG: putative phosphoribosyl transferase [Rhodobacteraceae bacterium HLUCCA12]